MRALIRVTINDPDGTLPSRESREEYNKAIIRLFSAIGFSPRSVTSSTSTPNQCDLEQSKDVQELFESLQGTIYEEEKKHLIMLGYTSAGQAKFVVCSINPDVLHIRARDDLFEKLRLACREICTKIWTHSDRMRGSRLRFRRKEGGPYLTLDDTIEVMEPGNKTVTILGHLIRRPLAAIPKSYHGKSILAASMFLLATSLFLFSPDLARPVQRILSTVKSFDVLYIQGALERTYSAFLVTFAITMLELYMKYIELRRLRPIVWNAGIEPTRGPEVAG